MGKYYVIIFEVLRLSETSLHPQINYSYFENKMLTFLISESKHEWECWIGSWLCFKDAINEFIGLRYPPALIKTPTIKESKNEVPIAADIRLLLIFRKNPLQK